MASGMSRGHTLYSVSPAGKKPCELSNLLDMMHVPASLDLHLLRGCKRARAPSVLDGWWAGDMDRGFLGSARRQQRSVTRYVLARCTFDTSQRSLSAPPARLPPLVSMRTRHCMCSWHLDGRVQVGRSDEWIA